MYQPASVVMTQSGFFWSRHSELHDDIMREYGITLNGSEGPNAVQLELYPPNCCYFAPISSWRLYVDQGVVPQWFDLDEADGKVREIVEREWLPSKVILPNERRNYVTGHIVACYGFVRTARRCHFDVIDGNSMIVHLEMSRVTRHGGKFCNNVASQLFTS